MGARARGLKAPSLAAVLAAAVLAAVAASCGVQQKTRPGQPGVDARDIMRSRMYPALRDSIAEYAALADSSPTVVEGLGLVAELPNTGSNDMPPNVRALLLDNLYRMGAGQYTQGTQNISPERILSSNQISAVEIRGTIPPLARKGTTFDVVVSALPNTQTTSLANGLLWTSELKLAGTQLETHTIAMARGPIFIPEAIGRDAGASDAPATQPSMEAKAKSAIALRKVLRLGRVVGGGVVTEERPLRLEMFSPGLGKAQAVERAINAHFPGIDKAAEAENDAIVQLTVPAEYRTRPAEFLDIVRHIYLRQDVPGFNEQKAVEIIKAMADPAAPRADLSIALAGLGRSILPDYIEPQYTSEDPNVRFWCARAGAQLQDVGGMVILQEFVKDPKSPLHQQAVEALANLGRGDTVHASLALADLLTSHDTAERIRGYEALAAMNSRLIRRYVIGKSFYMDVVPSNSPPLIYVSQTGAQRIALIGRPIDLPVGLLYVSPDSLLTVSVGDGSATPSASNGAPDGTVLAAAPTDPAGRAAPKRPENVLLYWRAPLGDRTVDVHSASDLPSVLARLGWTPDPKAEDYDRSAKFIGASYQRVVEMLNGLVKDQLIDATFAIQTAPNLAPTEMDLVNESRPENSTKQPAKSPGKSPGNPANPAATPALTPSAEPPLPSPGPAPSLAPLPDMP